MTTKTFITARYGETDMMGIVHHSVYALYYEQARVDFIGSFGVSYLQLEKDGLMLPLISLGCSYKKPLHFAAALKKPLVAMYGPTKADRTGPYGSKNSTVLLSPAKCAGCLKKKCDNWHCMHDITPDMVYKIYQEKVAEG